MIHLVIREPIAYQRTLCRALDDCYRGEFAAWFASGSESDFEARDDFERRFLGETGFASLFRALRADVNPVVILGGWSSSLAYKTLFISAALRVPILIWADHPHPRARSRAFETFRRAYLRLLSRRTVAFLACGRPTVEHLARFGIAREKILNFPYWVEVPDDWSPPKTVGDEGSAKEPLHLLAIGRLVAIKGFDVAIKAMPLANQNGSVADLLIVGDGPERQRLERLADSLKTGRAVRFAGSVDNAKVFEHLRNADALIVPSAFEPYGVVVLEALAHGRPVLASDEVIAAIDRGDGTGAIRFHRAGDAEELAGQIVALASDRKDLEHASHSARAIAEQWKPQRAAEMIQAILSERIQGASHSHIHDPRTLYQSKPQPTSNAS